MNQTAIGCLLLALPAFAQNFEVASVKPVAPGPGTTIVQPGCASGKFTARTNLSLTIAWAYGTSLYQLADVGKWPMVPARFEIEGAPGKPVNEPQCRAMVQALLSERFKLVVHRESSPMTVYALSVAKNGPKIKPASEGDTDGVHINGAKTFGTPKGWTMQELADFLGRFVSPTPVVDHTGLSGPYKITLDFAPPGRGGVPLGDGPDIFSAVEAQLGLKLDQRKEDVEMLVIDHVEQPEAN